ncbi:MAG: CoA-binding protein [Acidobacteria bacterium]|nr:CoA-binding protein [Acidobacteriota bacterium]
MRINDPETIKMILRECSTIAVVGLSSKPDRPSHGVAGYLQSAGYRIIGVNPNETEVLGQKVYPSLSAVPDRIDVVDIFRRSDKVAPIVDEAIEIGARAIWMQEGVVDDMAAQKALKAGLMVVVNRCMLKEHLKLRAEESPRRS